MTNIQLDTNVLTRLAQSSHALRGTALSAVRSLQSAGHAICVVPQNLFEFWVVATRPVSENGLGLSVLEAKAELDRIKSAFVLLPDTRALLDEWERLIVVHDCRGKPAHDARIVASMNVHGVKHLLTFNGKDFARYTDVTVLDVGSALSVLPPTPEP